MERIIAIIKDSRQMTNDEGQWRQKKVGHFLSQSLELRQVVNIGPEVQRVSKVSEIHKIFNILAPMYVFVNLKHSF